MAGGEDYQFFRNVVDFGADNTGNTDAAESINAAISSWNNATAGGAGGSTRCGEECGNTFTQGAVVYFPPGTYKICSPVIQYYYTQFIGDPWDPPIIYGCDTFKGIALFDTDPYIPGGAGSQWYVNQNQFFRQIRNFIFDMYDMPDATDQDDQPLVPTGIHWQVAQATSLQNLVFLMPSTTTTTAVGIFSVRMFATPSSSQLLTHVSVSQENGSGGFVSNITFGGGNIGWRAGSQQYTARNLQFELCNTAVQMVWDWGWTWQQITINGGSIGFNISGVGGDSGQGTGSVSIIDSVITQTTIGILTNALGTSPNIVLDNTVFDSVPNEVVTAEGGTSLLSGSSDLWATGARYNGSMGSSQTGSVVGAPSRAAGLVDSATGYLFVRDRPQYENLGTTSFRIATSDGGCANDGTGDQTTCINTFLQKALAANQVAYFPSGIYVIGGTVLIPTGSRVQGTSWSQIQGAGYYFGDVTNPQVMIQVGNKGDVGSMEIVEMLFSVQGNTAGAILMEWNVAADSQGSAGMWDSHLRVGGGDGTDLDMATCPKFSDNSQCIAATLLLHVTSQSNGYFENVWAWVADHDNDFSLYDQFDSTISQISIFSARGMLIESQGPSWFIGSSCEHSVLYNYQLSNAQDIYMGHIQTESPYFQPLPAAPAPFGDAAASFPNDPDFSSCNLTASSVNEQCRYAWGLRIVDSNSVIIHGAGLYSFFNDYYQDCDDTHNCQERILEVTGSTGVVIFNLFTVSTVQIATGIDGSMLLQATNQRGFSTEVSVWLPLPGGDNVDLVWVGTEIWSAPTIGCTTVPCMLIIPTTSLPSKTTIIPSSYTTSFEYGDITSTTVGGVGTVVFVTTIITTTISIPSIVVSGIGYSNINITSAGTTDVTLSPSINIPPLGIPLPNGSGGTTTRTITLPPWPQVNFGPTALPTIDPGASGNTGTLSSSTTYFTGITSAVSASGATITTVTFPNNITPITISCPAETSIVFDTPAIAVSTTCTQTGTEAFTFSCPTTGVFTFLASTEAAVSVDCTLVTAWSTGEDAATSTSSGALVVYGTDWPPYGSIVPVTTTISTPEPSSSGVVVPCTAWFFFICIDFGEIHIGGWYWVLPPGIYGPGPPPINLIDWPPGLQIEGNLPDWPKITIGSDNQITTDEEPECETETADVCSITTIVSVSASTTKTVSSTSFCETITGCSISGVSSTIVSTEMEGTQTIAPIWSWDPDVWPTADLGAAYTSSVWAVLSAELASASIDQLGTTISFTSGATNGPTCAGASTACGGTLCSGYYCTATPTGFPPGYLAPNDPSSQGYTAPTTHVSVPNTVTTTSVPTSPTTTTAVCPATPTCNCNESECDACSPVCCQDGTCSSSTTTAAAPTSTCDCELCGSPFSDNCCTSDCEGTLQLASLAGAAETLAVRRERRSGSEFWGIFRPRGL